MRRLAVLGASGHGKVVAEIAELNGWDEVIFFDDAYPEIKALEVWQVVGNSENLLKRLNDFQGCVVAIGDNAIRLKKFQLLQAQGAHFPCLVHPRAMVSGYANIASGTVMMAGAVVNAFAKVGECCILNTACTLDHDCDVGRGVHISPGANLAGAVCIGQCAWIGIGASVKQGISIGANTVVGAGACVVADLPDDVLALGVPAKIKD